MASRAHSEGVRHVGRIVDPLARDDGETEPVLELDDVDARAASGGESGDESPGITAGIPAERPEGESEAQGPLDPDMHPVKARLLAKARANQGGEPEPESSNFPEAAPAAGGFDEFASPSPHRAPSAPISPAGRSAFSPNVIALLGTLLGLAAVASVIAVATALDPQPGKAVPVEDSTASAAESEPKQETPEPESAKPKRVKIPGPWRIADASGESGVRVIKGTIGVNPFLRAIQDAGLEKKEAYRVLTALKDLRNLDRCGKSDEFVALVERSSKRVKAFEYIVSKEEVYQARESADALLVGKKLDLKVERIQRSAGFAIDGDIDAAAERAGLERGIAKVLATALDGHMSLEELKKGDRIRVVAQEVAVLGEFSRYSGVEAVEVLSGKEKPLRIYYFRGSGNKGYFDAAGRSPYEGGWRKPVKDAPVTSKFNPKRMHPVLKKVMPHTGTDFGAPAGTPVGSSSYGTVSYVGYAGASGNLVKVEHPNDIETGYAHLSRFAEGLKVGDKVKRLQLVGYVGSTGRSTGPHLHFTAKKKGEFFDAETLNLDGMRVLPPGERDAFAKVRARYDAALDAIALPAAVEEPVAAAPTTDPSEEGDPDIDLGAGGDAPPAAKAAASAAPAAAPKPGPPPQPAKPVTGGGASVYLTDKDLMQMQSGSDDGEVDE